MLPANQKEATSNRDKRLVFEELEDELRKVEREKRKKEKKRLHSVSRSILRTLLIDFQLFECTIGVNILISERTESSDRKQTVKTNTHFQLSESESKLSTYMYR